MTRLTHLIGCCMLWLAGPALAADDSAFYNMLGPSVVRITITGTTPDGIIESKTGAGVIITSDGYALTAMHTFYAGNDTTAPYVGTVDMKATVTIAGAPSADVRFEVVDTNIALPNPKERAVLIKLHVYPGLSYRPARICRTSPPPGTALWGLGFPNGGDLAVRPGNFESGNGKSGMWQTGIQLVQGFSGGPVVLADGSVVALVEEGIGAQAAAGTRVVPVFQSPYYRSGLTMTSCGAPQTSDLTATSYAWQVNYLGRQIDRLYAPLNLRLQLGEAEYLYFTETFYARFGRRSAQQFTEVTDANGVKLPRPIPMSDAEWAVWMDQVRTKFKPHNDAILKLVSDNANLLDGGVVTDCYKKLLLHFTAFDQSLSLANADPSLRTWAPTHSWPACITPETAKTLQSLQAKQLDLSTRLSARNAANSSDLAGPAGSQPGT